MESRDNLSQNTLDHTLIHGPLKSHVLATSQRLQQESQKDRLPQLSEFMLKIADNNYDAVRCLVIQSYKYASPANVICRSSVDLIFTLCLIFSKRQKYLDMYFKSGWREKYEELQDQRKSIYVQTHGTDWLIDYERYLDSNAITVGISQEEKNHPKTISYFPTPHQIIDHKRYKYYLDLDNLTLEFLEKLNEKYYSATLSQMIHYSDIGLAYHVAPLYPDYPKEQQILIISQPVAISMMVLLVLLSEISIFFAYDDRQKLRELWTYLAETIPLHSELYQIKYRKLL